MRSNQTVDLTDLKKELFRGKMRHVWRGYLHFNEIRVSENKITLLHNSIELVTYNFEPPGKGGNIHFIISDGSMKISLSWKEATLGFIITILFLFWWFYTYTMKQRR